MSQLTEALITLTHDLELIQNEEHEDYKTLLKTLDATKLRLLGLAQLQLNSDIQFAEQTKKVARKTIDNDFKLGITDSHNSVKAELNKRKTDLLQILYKINATQLIEKLNNIKIE